MLNLKSRRKMQRAAMATVLAKRPKVHVRELDKSTRTPNLQQISNDSHFKNVTEFFKGWQKSGQTLTLDERAAEVEDSTALPMRKFYDVENSLRQQAEYIAEIERHINFGLLFGIAGKNINLFGTTTGRFKSGEYTPAPHWFSINLESSISDLKPQLHGAPPCDCFMCSNPERETPFLTAREVASPHRTFRVSQKLYDKVMEISKYHDVKVEVPNADDGMGLHHIVPDHLGTDYWDLLNTYPLRMPPPDSNSQIGEMARKFQETFSELRSKIAERGGSQVHDSFSIVDAEEKAKALGVPLDFIFPVDEDHSASGRMTVTRLKERNEAARKYFLDIGGVVFDPNQHIDDSLTKPEPYAQMVLTADVIASRVQNFVLRNAVEDTVLVLFVIKERNLRLAAIDALLELNGFEVFSDFVVSDKCKHIRHMPRAGKRIAVVRNCESYDLCATSQHLMIIDNEARNKSIQTGKAHLDLQSIWRMRFAENENATIDIYGYRTTWRVFKLRHYPDLGKSMKGNTLENEELFIRRISENSNTVKGI